MRKSWNQEKIDVGQLMDIISDRIAAVRLWSFDRQRIAVLVHLETEKPRERIGGN